MNDEADNRERAMKDAAVTAAVESLRGMFDGVIVVGSYQDEGGNTVTVIRGDGNWHAQNGAMQYVLKRRMTEADIEARQRAEGGG